MWAQKNVHAVMVLRMQLFDYAVIFAIKVYLIAKYTKLTCFQAIILV